MIDQKFRNTSEQVIASYNYTDIAEGTGIVIYNGLVTQDGVGSYKYLLSTQSLESEQDNIRGSIVQGCTAFQKSLDVDFDLPEFNLPKIVRGKAVVTLCFTPTMYTSGTYPVGYLILKLRKWDGTTETEIASVQTSNYTYDPNSAKIKALELEVPKTQFKKGETLRLTIEGWCKFTNEVDVNKYSLILLGASPTNQDGDTAGDTQDSIKPSTDDPRTTTQLKAFIPFDIDV